VAAGAPAPVHAAVLVRWQSADQDAPLLCTYLLPSEDGWSGVHTAPKNAARVGVSLFYWTQMADAPPQPWQLEIRPLAQPPQPRTWRIAVAHQALRYPPTIEENTALSVEAIRQAGREKVDLLCLSENFLSRNVPLPLAQRAMTFDHPSIRALCAAAAEARLYLTFSFPEKAPENRIYVTAPLVGPDGGIIGQYRKNYLSQKELQLGIAPASGFPVFQTPLGRIGILICYDLWFPDTALALAKHGADIICHPLAGDPFDSHWDYVWRARALDHQAYVLTSVTHDCGGRAPSRVIAPDGSIAAETRSPNALAVATVQLPWQQELFGFSVGAATSEVRNVMNATRAMHGRASQDKAR
jgi:predicted amidohydrolase